MHQKRLRVLHVSPAHPADDPRIVDKQIPALAERYEVWCSLPGRPAVQTAGVRYLRLPRFHRLWLRIFTTHLVIFWHILRIRPAILHLYMPELLPLALLSRLAGIRVLYEVQENLFKKLPSRKRNNDPTARLLFRTFDRLARQRFPIILTEHRYREEYSDAVKPQVVIYNYPDLKAMEAYRRPYRTARAENPELLYIGVISMNRALDTLVRAIALLRNDYPTVVLHLFGRRAFGPAELESIPEYAQVRDNLLFHGHVPHRLALPFAARCVAGLALLKPRGDYPDSYPTKLFEYMALGLPVLTSDFPLYRQVVDPLRCGFCIDPENAVAVADRLQFLIRNPGEAEAMGLRGREGVAERYNWRTEARKLIDFYEIIKQ